MKSSRLCKFYLLAIAILSIACSTEKFQVDTRVVKTEEQTSWVTISVQNGLPLPALVVIPAGEGPYPAIVVLHDCSGLMSSSMAGEVDSHFLDWVQFGKEHEVVMVFPDSYTLRGFNEFCNVSPPEDRICSPAYERPKDAYAVLTWLSLQSYVDIDRVGLLGFSQGASTAIASIYSNPKTELKNWTIQNNTKTYNVPAPVTVPGALNFKTAVAYYPDVDFHGYFGNDYLPYTPLLIHAASLDPLHIKGNAINLVNTAILNGASSQTNNEVLVHIYEGASHSFDGALSGINYEANVRAKETTLSWFKNYLKF